MDLPVLQEGWYEAPKKFHAQITKDRPLWHKLKMHMHAKGQTELQIRENVNMRLWPGLSISVKTAISQPLT